MTRNTLKRWVGACLVGSAVAGGCNRQESQIAKNDGDLLPPVTAWAHKDPKPAAAKGADGVILATSYHVPDPTPELPAKEKHPATELPPVVWADPPAPVKTPTSVPTMPPPLPAATVAAAVPVSSKSPSKPTQHDEPALGASHYGHAPDYSWVCGEVMHTRKGWRLRYAGVDETDTYGGSVTLNGDPHLEELKEGEVFVVKGHLQSPDAHTTAPVYVVSDVRPQGH